MEDEVRLRKAVSCSRKVAELRKEVLPPKKQVVGPQKVEVDIQHQGGGIQVEMVLVRCREEAGTNVVVVWCKTTRLLEVAKNVLLGLLCLAAGSRHPLWSLFSKSVRPS
jgi:hypothetical protein